VATRFLVFFVRSFSLIVLWILVDGLVARLSELWLRFVVRVCPKENIVFRDLFFLKVDRDNLFYF
jgi:hypothetical protein